MSSRTSPLNRPPSRTSLPAGEFVRLAHLHRLKQCEKVAAVCYRLGFRGIEFLLVQTRNRRWTFPKGSSEPGLTHAQAAALEAFEEAGVHGRIEEAALTRYVQARGRSRGSDIRRLVVEAYLCEVLRLEPPQERNRKPTWFAPRTAKLRLREGREPESASELSRVVDLAVSRIHDMRLHPSNISGAQYIDALQRVAMEAWESVAPFYRAGKTRLNVHSGNRTASPPIELPVRQLLLSSSGAGGLGGDGRSKGVVRVTRIDTLNKVR